MNVTLEYLAVGLLIVTILLAFNQVVGSLTPRLESVRSEQLFTVAERVMDKIVLTPGYPEDWGRDIEVTPETLKDFGLALAGSRSPYVLDPDKVMRLANLSTLPNPLLLNASRLAEILALKMDFGFHFVMKPALSINVNYSCPIDTRKDQKAYPSFIKITLTNWHGVGVPNANITGMYVIVGLNPGNGNQGGVREKYVFVKNCLTNAVGVCTLDYTDELEKYSSQKGEGSSEGGRKEVTFLIVHANWQGFVSIKGEPMTCDKISILQGYIIGNYIFVDHNVEVDEGSSGAAHVKDDLLQAVPMYGDLLSFTGVTWCRNREGGFKDHDPLCNAAGRVLPSAKQWYLIGYINYVEPLASHVFVFVKYQGNWVPIVVNRTPIIDITYGAKGTVPANSVTVRRLAVLYNYPYVVELTIWRRVEGWP